MGRQANNLTLVALDIEGKWNVPLLENAAQLSRAELTFASSRECSDLAAPSCDFFEHVAKKFQTILACETGVKARSIFELPTPRGTTAFVVGNEQCGIPKSVLKHCSSTVTIPMFCRQLSSVNVAASSAVGLYVLERDLARKGVLARSSGQSPPELLIGASADPAECGSLLRSAAAFGWRKVYLQDPAGSWFTKARETISLSRAAARREINPIAVLNADELPEHQFEKVIWCTGDRIGAPLSRFRMGDCRNALLVYGIASLPDHLRSLACEDVYVDFANTRATARHRHGGSTILAVLAQQLRSKRHG